MSSVDWNADSLQPGFAENNADFAEDLPFVVLDGVENPVGLTGWRRGWDSNPRDPFRPNGFQDRRFQPLTHPSAVPGPRQTNRSRDNT